MAGEFIKAVLSAGMGLGKKITLCINGLLIHLENASTLMLHLGSKWNKVARMTIYILHIF